MDLNTLWFAIVTVLFIGFFFLEGFDFGVGMLMPVLGKNDADRKVVINSIGPFWDANEVWLIMVGTALFAAFPQWYATMFSGFYLVMFALLVALIVRGVGIEFRNRSTNRRWHNLWDGMIFGGSLVSSFGWGVVVSNLIKGVAIDSKMHYVGNGFELLNPYALVGGLAFVGLFLFHGAIFLSLKTEGTIRERASRAAKILWLPALLVAGAYGLYGYFATDMFTRLSALPLVSAGGAVAALLVTGWCLREEWFGKAFALSGLTIVLTVLTIFGGLFPRVMVSSLDPAYNLTVTNASASPYSLEIMSWVSLTLIPVVIAYQAWNYYIFRQRVSYKSGQHL